MEGWGEKITGFLVAHFKLNAEISSYVAENVLQHVMQFVAI